MVGTIVGIVAVLLLVRLGIQQKNRARAARSATLDALTRASLSAAAGSSAGEELIHPALSGQTEHVGPEDYAPQHAGTASSQAV